MGDILNFIVDEEIVVYVNGFVLYYFVVVDGVKLFVLCNESNGIFIVNKLINSVVVGLDIFKLGINYFIVNIDFMFCCDFGLCLNVSVKENNCKVFVLNFICFGWG